MSIKLLSIEPDEILLRRERWEVLYALIDAKGDYLKIGSEIHPEKNGSIESSHYWFANENSLPSAPLRTVPFVCDLPVLCGFAEYGYRDGEKDDEFRQSKCLKNSNNILV